MNRSSRAGLILAGYVAALLAACLAGWLYNASISLLRVDTSGGMYAWGELMAALAVFVPLALATTALALWFVRRHHGVWMAMAGASLAFALGGLVSVLAPAALLSASALVLPELMRLAQLLGAPLWIAAFALFAFLAPSRTPRRILVAAVGVELVVAVYALVYWLAHAPQN